jgi:hypothetical protein
MPGSWSFKFSFLERPLLFLVYRYKLLSAQGGSDLDDGAWEDDDVPEGS